MKRYILLTTALTLLGAAGGVVGGYLYGKHKWLALADHEIETVKAMYERHMNTNAKDAEPQKEVQQEPQKNEQLTLFDDKDGENSDKSDAELKAKYVDYTKKYSAGTGNEPIVPSTSIPMPKPTKPKVKKSSIYVISPEEFANSEYVCDTLIYYADKVLADSDGNIIKNVEEVIGPEALSTFGRYKDDAVYVRDDDKQSDYEILWDARTYEAAQSLNESLDD